MRRLHKITGLVVVVAFLLTGQYMEFKYAEWAGVDDALRLMYRSRHIYILMGGMVNICVGLYFTRHTRAWRKVLQMIGSALILTTPFAMIAAFFYEPAAGALAREITSPSVILLFAGVMLHLVSTARQGKDVAAVEQVSSKPVSSAAASS